MNNASSAVCRRAEVYEADVKVEPIPFRSEFFNITVTYYFRLCLGVQQPETSICSDVAGLAYFSKRVLLYGGESNVRIFKSGGNGSECSVTNLPVACVEAAEPLILGARLLDTPPRYIEPLPADLPACVNSAFPGGLSGEPADTDKVLQVTLGLFSIIMLEREVQILIPAYDYSVPERDSSLNEELIENPCEVFRRIRFPVEEFFPERPQNCRN